MKAYVRTVGVLAVVVVASRGAQAQTGTGLDAKVQAPELKAPERASLVGQLSGVAFGPADVARGGYTLPSPFGVPTERGSMLASPFPSYGAENGISEWGTGWQTQLSITRFRTSGDLDYATDELTGPYGRMVKGADGAWYPVGLSQLVRVKQVGDVLTAYLPDGTQAVYGGAARVVTARGTYAWMLTEVRTVTGRKTWLEWTANPSGRQFVSSVWYGGVGDDYQYRVDLAYQIRPGSVEDYRSGQLLKLDRRVKTVTVLAKNAQTALFEERWRYELLHQAEGYGPGFFLASVQQVFRSGERPPATTYTYNLATNRLTTAPLGSAPKVAQLLSAMGADVLQPTRSTVFDADDDGQPDVELSYDYRLARQTETGFTIESLQPAADASPYCRKPVSVTNPPRVLAQLRSGAGDEEQYVVALQTNGTTSWAYVCNRLGQVKGTPTVAGSWTLGSTTRLVDVNRDHKPDLVRVGYGQVRVFPNTSTSTTFSFGTEKVGTLTPAFTADTAWVQDFNGDGIPDLIARSSSTLVVWYGKGNFTFDPAGRSFAFQTASLTYLTSLSGYGLTFVDANKDGLTDVVLSSTSTNSTYLYMNRGSVLTETAVPGLRSVDLAMSKPVVMDLRGSGNTEVGFTKLGQGYSVALDGPETGLMATADDGKGTLLSFEYGRAAPAAGGKQRQSVLTRLWVQSSGYDTVSYAYAYGGPKLHTLGKFLLGYDVVQRNEPLGSEVVSFLNEDRYSGVFKTSAKQDLLVPGIEKFSEKTYDDATYQGIPWKRLATEETGWRATDGSGGAAMETTSYLAYEREICPSRIETSTAWGTLTTQRTHSSLLAFESAMSCLIEDVIESGVHLDSSLNFTHETYLARNAVGLVARVESVTPSGRWVTQSVGFTSDWLISTVSSPGRGAATAGYDPVTRLLTGVTQADGSASAVVARNPVTDQVERLRHDRGGAAWEQYFRFDGQERLRSMWSDLGQATEFNPDVQLTYHYATAATPASVYRSELVDAASSSVHDSIDYLTAAGASMGSADHVPEGWAFGRLTWRSRGTGETLSYVRPTAAPGTDPTALDTSALFGGAEEVERSVTGPLGVIVDRVTRIHADVSKRLAESLFTSGDQLARTVRENGTFEQTWSMDATRRVRAYWDESGAAYGYTYDALGRLRAVQLPDGALHKASYDGHGRVSRVERGGIATVEYRFDPSTGLVVQKRFLSPSPVEVLARSVTYSYDAVGRVALERHEAVDCAAVEFRRYYDGATPAAPSARTSLGFLTAVQGDGFTKLAEYKPDGKLAKRTLTVTGWRSVETEFSYVDSGSLRDRRTTVRSATGSVLSSTFEEARYDAYGRPSETRLGGATLIAYGYDSDGQLLSAAFGAGGSVKLAYDPLTRIPTGTTFRTAAYDASVSQRMSARGLVDQESTKVGSLSLERAYTYSPQRFLEGAQDAQARYGYAFSSAGKPTRIDTNGVATTIVESGSSIVAGELVYALDGLGRTVLRNDLILTYGADGQVARAARGTANFQFLYDEGGQRIAKKVNGLFVAAYLEEGYLDVSGLAEPVKVAGRTVGFWKNGIFQAVATDPRGTVLADTAGTPRIASPFGARDVHPDLAAAIDFVEKGWDADLGLVRMGVRDYDPAIARFTTPDPLYLEKPELCLRSPAQCNLYAYAQDPISASDPSGTEQESFSISAALADRMQTRDPFGQPSPEAMAEQSAMPAAAAPTPPAPAPSAAASAAPAAPQARASESSHVDQRTAINAAAYSVLVRNQEVIEGRKGVLVPVAGKTLLPRDGSTWCSNFLVQLARQCSVPLPFSNANDADRYLKNSEDFGSTDSLAKASKLQQEGWFVAASLPVPGGSGHVNALVDEPKRDVSLPVGMVVKGDSGGVWVAQSGGSVGYLNIRWAWTATDLAKVKFYYFKGAVGCSK